MGWRIRIIFCLIAGVLALSAPGAALASGGTTTSAGDQQYTDPLGNTNTTPSSPPATSTPAPSAPTSPPSSSASSAPSQPAASAPTPASTAAADPSKTLPFTGLNVGLVVALGLGLLGAGFLLRGLTRRA